MENLKKMSLALLVLSFGGPYGFTSPSLVALPRFDFSIFDDPINELRPRQDEPQGTDYRQAFGLALEKLTRMDTFKLTYRLRDVDHQQTLLEGEVRKGEDLALQLNFYSYASPEEVQPSQVHPFNVYAYDQFRLIYTNQLAWFNSLGLIDQNYLLNDQEKAVFRNLDQTLIQVDGQVGDQGLNLDRLVAALCLFPDPDLIKNIRVEDLQYDGGTYQYHGQLTEIPEGLFRKAASFQLKNQLDLQVLQDSASQDWQVSLQPSMTVARQESGLNIMVASQGKLSDLPSVAESGDSSSTLPQTHLIDFQEDQALRSDNVTNKLRYVDIIANPRDNTYHVSLEGIAELFELNLFGRESADLESSNYRLDIYLEEVADAEVPSFTSLDLMTSKEAETYLRRELKKVD